MMASNSNNNNSNPNSNDTNNDSNSDGNAHAGEDSRQERKELLITMKVLVDYLQQYDPNLRLVVKEVRSILTHIHTGWHG